MATAVARIQNCIIIHEFDLVMGAHSNQMNKDTRSRVKEFISSGKCLGVCFGFPCGIFLAPGDRAVREHLR